MGKGGQANVSTHPIQSTISKDGHWTSPYNPLDPKAPELPTKGEIKAAIPQLNVYENRTDRKIDVVRLRRVASAD